MALSNAFTGVLSTVGELFFKPFNDVFPNLTNRKFCPAYDDELWLRAGIQRVMDKSESGRGFLQEYAVQWDVMPKRSNYFEALKSSRRADMAEEMNLKIAAHAESSFEDRLSGIDELKDYEVFAIDGHWHRGATHDPKSSEKKISTGHFFSLNLRCHTLRNLAVNEYHKEHDMHVLKRLKPAGIRQGVERGRRVLAVYDRAGIDFKFWKRRRKECAVYFLSRVKEGMVFEQLLELPWDKKDSRNAGVIRDHQVQSAEKIHMRVIQYTDPETGEEYEFLTNVMDLPPGVLVELYRRRWEIEKVFDDLKNKLSEKRSWSSDLVGKRSQGQLLALTYNLVRLSEEHLETKYQVANQAEQVRRNKRKAELARKARRNGRQVSSLRLKAHRATQRSVKLFRWIRGSLRSGITVAAALPFLRASYATL